MSDPFVEGRPGGLPQQNTMALVSLVSGVAGLVLSLFLGCIVPGASMLGMVASLMAIITGFMGRQEALKTGVGGEMAIAGAATGCANLLIWFGLVGFSVAALFVLFAVALVSGN